MENNFKNTKFSENLINLDKRLLLNYYKSIGYYDVEVTSTSAEIQDTANINIIYTQMQEPDIQSIRFLLM